jgi:hypothetical protein
MSSELFFDIFNLHKQLQSDSKPSYKQPLCEDPIEYQDALQEDLSVSTKLQPHHRVVGNIATDVKK